MTELRLPDVNRVMLGGRLTQDPDRRYAPDGTHVTSFTIAFNRRYRTREGRYAEHTGYVTVMTYLRLAEVCGQYLHKGSPVLVEGRLQMRELPGARGEKRQRLEIRAESVHFLEKIAGTAPPSGGGAPGPAEEGTLL